MSVKVMDLVFSTYLPSSSKFVLLALADCANEQGESIYPSVATICRKTSLSERTVQRCLLYLMDRDILHHAGYMKSGVNIYRIDIKRLVRLCRKTVAMTDGNENGDEKEGVSP